MSLLILPAIAVIIYFRGRHFSFKGLLVATFIGGTTILFLNHIILFGLPDAMKYADIFLVNQIGMPFYSGAIAVVFSISISGYFILQWSKKRKMPILSHAVFGLMFFLIGYTTYFMIIIRSQSDPSIDEHNPENLVSLTSYLKRESYPIQTLDVWPELYQQNQVL